MSDRPSWQGECGFCGVEVDTLQTIDYGPFVPTQWCEVCRAVLPVCEILDPRATLSNKQLAAILCGAANVILREMRKGGEGPEKPRGLINR